MPKPTKKSMEQLNKKGSKRPAVAAKRPGGELGPLAAFLGRKGMPAAGR